MLYLYLHLFDTELYPYFLVPFYNHDTVIQFQYGLIL
nr:hypothetical protein CoNPh38_CDS0340 [Staphylococcus phage S-CoN_Ph38]